MAAQDAGRRVHGQDGVRRRGKVVQDVRAQAQAPHESVARRRRGRADGPTTEHAGGRAGGGDAEASVWWWGIWAICMYLLRPFKIIRHPKNLGESK